MRPPEKNESSQSPAGPVDHTKVPMAGVLRLEQICGQAEVIAQLKTYGDLYRGKGETPEHILLTGADGMDKRTIARAFAKTYGGVLRESESREFKRKGDLSAILTSLEVSESLILLNVQDLKEHISDVLISALDEFQISLIIGAYSGVRERIIQFPLSRFTFLATAPTESDVHPKLLKCFSLRLALKIYRADELERIVLLLANENGLETNCRFSWSNISLSDKRLQQRLAHYSNPQYEKPLLRYRAHESQVLVCALYRRKKGPPLSEEWT